MTRVPKRLIPEHTTSDDEPQSIEFEAVANPRRQAMDKHFVQLLMAFDEQKGVGTKVAYPTQFPKLNDRYARGFSTNYAELRHFGMLERHPTNDEGEAVWSLTQLGSDFVRGFCEAAQWIYVLNGVCVRTSQSTLHVTQVENAEISGRKESGSGPQEHLESAHP